MENLIPNYLGYYSEAGITTAALMEGALIKEDIDGMFRHLQTFLGTIPGGDNVDKSQALRGTLAETAVRHLLATRLPLRCGSSYA